jgi:ABC-2 type transport system ATP-binding protein
VADGPAVALRDVQKRFGPTVAVAGLSLDVPRGSFLGLVGPNGAGKTTTMRMATGLLRPDAGAVWVDGIDVWRDPVAAKRHIGVLPEDLNLFERLTGMELLTYHGLLRRMDIQVITSRARETLDVLNLADAADTMVVDYSHGMRKKIALAAALRHSPRVLFLDEPFEAIDPVSARAIRLVLERLTHTGATVIFSAMSWNWSRACATGWRSSTPGGWWPAAPWTRSARGAARRGLRPPRRCRRGAGREPGMAWVFAD